MAAFSSLALLGLGLAGGSAAATLARRRGPIANLARESGQTEGIFGPRSGQQAEGITPPPAPAPTAQTQSEATRAGQQAGQRQRRRATPASTRPVGRTNPSAILQPASLLGY